MANCQKRSRPVRAASSGSFPKRYCSHYLLGCGGLRHIAHGTLGVYVLASATASQPPRGDPSSPRTKEPACQHGDVRGDDLFHIGELFCRMAGAVAWLSGCNRFDFSRLFCRDVRCILLPARSHGAALVVYGHWVLSGCVRAFYHVPASI